MDESILNSIKKVLGISETYTYFDADILMHINSVFVTLCQLGIGPSIPYHVYDETSKWSDFLNDTSYSLVKSYIAFKVRLMFDPPSGSALDAMNLAVNELEWRLTNNYDILNCDVDTIKIYARGTLLKASKSIFDQSKYVQFIFDLDSDWDSMTIAVSFFDENDDESAIILDGTSCDLPEEFNNCERFQLSLTGTTGTVTKTTNKLTFTKGV